MTFNCISFEDNVCFYHFWLVILTDYAIIDVRDEEEFHEGHLIGANHIPWGKWRNPDFVKETGMKFIEKDEVLIHCQKSQVRGPSCARLLIKFYGEYSEINPSCSVPQM